MRDRQRVTHLLCQDCGENFSFTEKERRFLLQKFGSNAHMPVRCIPCRKSRRNGTPRKIEGTSDREFAKVWEE